MSSYDLYAPSWASTPDTEFKGQDENPFDAGVFVWTSFDHLGEPTPFNADPTILTNFHTPEERVKAAEEELKVVAYKSGREWATSAVKTTGAAAKLLLTPDRPTISADGRELSFLTVTAADEDGLMVPRSKPELKFEITGPGEIVPADNGDPTDHTSFQSISRSAFNGLALALVRAKPGSSDPIMVRVLANRHSPADVTLNAAHPWEN